MTSMVPARPSRSSKATAHSPRRPADAPAGAPEESAPPELPEPDGQPRPDRRSESPFPPPHGQKWGLRERKKARTRQAIRDAAYRLFQEQGYDATPVDQIAEVAEVSPSTVFRYFATKEDIVLSDEYDPFMVVALHDRPLDEPPVESIRTVLKSATRYLIEHHTEEIVVRSRLVRDVPALRNRRTEAEMEAARAVCQELADRTGRSPDDLEIRVLSAAVTASVQEAVEFWVRRADTEELEAVIDRTFDLLSRGLTL